MRKTLLLSGCIVAALGCGGSAVDSNATQNYLGTQGPGDVWSWQLNDSTFTASNQTQGYTYSGTKSVLPTGFLKLTVTNTTDPGVTNGQSAYALELTNTALVLKMAGADTQPPIVAASLGSNPPGPQVSFNFVAVGSATFQQATDQAYGHVTFTVTGNHYDGTSKRFAIDGTALADGPSDFVGNNGLMTDTGANPPATGAMTPSGVCAIDYGPAKGGVIGVLQPSANVDLADLASRNYRGFLINQGKTQCVVVTPNGDGTLHGAGYANPSGVETGTFDNGTGVTVSFTSQPAPGEVRVSIDTGQDVETVVAAINQVDGKAMLFGFGVGGDGKPYNIILVED
ncbi:MAG TPA: hypothetical protein VMI31_18240 [Fimbriimonadaceae bacterium]|nr:hypothetical protein [Fimbriimonadaceae bacterium]